MHFEASLGKQFKRPRLQNNQNKMDWRFSSSNRVPALQMSALQARSPEFTKRPKIVCSASYVDIRSRANTTRGLDYEHMIKARAHKEGVRIGKTPKKLASICCP
jgi:hypothetical protein